jgi:uncharacterized protein (DUF58 family)
LGGKEKEAPLPGLRTLQNNNLAVLLLAALLTAALLTTLAGLLVRLLLLLAGLLLPTAATLLPALLVLLITLVRHESTPWVANNNVSVGLTVPDPISMVSRRFSPRWSVEDIARPLFDRTTNGKTGAVFRGG